jgi:hypothetical protein
MQQEKKLKTNFWLLVFKRFSGPYDNFFEMFKKCAPDTTESRGIVRAVIRTWLETVIVLLIGGIAAFALNWMYPKDATFDKIIMIGTPIALGILGLVTWLTFIMLRGFFQNRSLMKKFMSGGGAYDGLEVFESIVKENIIERWIFRIKIAYKSRLKRMSKK